jgi:Mannitol-1-phosphate/altronate dehydrogenases
MLPHLSAQLIRADFLRSSKAALPPATLLDLPERGVMFGTGALLRGLVGHLLDESNRAGKFNGRIVAIGSTGSGRDDLLNSQDGLFTLLGEGVQDGRTVRAYKVISSISRAISAAQWDSVLQVARNPDIGVIFSNTTEVGIALEKNDGPELLPPKSFPAKLTRFLFERARAFDYSASAGVIVVPCELIDRNGELLGELALQLAEEWRLGDRFTQWLCESVSFANTLVDRIVSGAPDLGRMDAIEAELGFRDSLVTVCEPYRMLAVEGDDKVREWVGHVSVDPGFFATDEVGPYRERKVRILNGGHTTMVPAALLAGLEHRLRRDVGRAARSVRAFGNLRRDTPAAHSTWCNRVCARSAGAICESIHRSRAHRHQPARNGEDQNARCALAGRVLRP